MSKNQTLNELIKLGKQQITTELAQKIQQHREERKAAEQQKTCLSCGAKVRPGDDMPCGH